MLPNKMRLDKNLSRASLPGPGGAFVHQRWTVDYPEDIEFMQALFQKLPEDVEMPRFDLIVKTLSENPELLKINEMYWDAHRDPDKLPEHDAQRINLSGAGQ